MLKKLLIAATLGGLSLTLPAFATADPATPPVQAVTAPAALTPLIDSTALQALVASGTVQVFDLRSPEDYAAGHIPGALNTPYGSFRGPQDNPGELRSAEALSEVLRAAGVDADSRIVIAHGGKDSTDFGAAARVYWTLKVGGLKQLSILDGGTRQWVAAGGALDQSTPSPVASDFSYRYDDSQLVSSEQLAEQLRDFTAPALLDARPQRFFKGEARVDAAARYGTLPGARQLDFNSFFAPGSTTLKPLAELKAVVAEAGLDSSRPLLSFCNTGHWAATNWFVLSELVGQPEVKLYAASMVEWSQRELPMANEPSRLTALYQDVKRALE